MRDDFDDIDSGGGASDVILAFLLGGLTGAALALLYAPRTGQETRDLIGERLRETAERGREMKREVVGRSRALVDEATGYVEEGRQTMEQRKERLAAAVDAGRQAYREERSKGGGDI
jgi:gas vesicle protein